MWGDRLVDACCQCCFFDNLPESEPGHTGATVGDEEVVAAFIFEDTGPCCFYIGLYFLLCLLAKGNESLFVALAYNANKSSVHVAG